MGYDMFFVHPGEDEPEDAEYFRLNIWAMGRYRSAMHHLGMVYDYYDYQPAWPDYSPPEGATEVAEQAYEDQYREALKPILIKHPAGGDTIPVHKFGSNDGWIVTPEEIRAALIVYEMYSDPKKLVESHEIEIDYWQKWIDYLKRAVEHGGFRVY